MSSLTPMVPLRNGDQTPENCTSTHRRSWQPSHYPKFKLTLHLLRVRIG